MSFVLAIDAVTTGVRATVFGADGTCVAGAYRELKMLYPRPGWVEQDAEDVWHRTRAVIAEALRSATCAPRDVLAVGITNQRASAVAWDANTVVPVAPMIIWQDGRTAERCRELGEAGVFMTPNMTATKFEWLVRNVPAADACMRSGRLRLGTLDSFLCAKLSGSRHVTDVSNACTTGLYAHFDQRWDPAIVEAVSLSPEWLPKIVDSSGDLGITNDEAFGAEVRIAALCGDQQASLFGLACREPGLTKCSYGTAAMVDAHTGNSLAIGGAGTYPLVAWSIDGEAAYCVEGTVITAGAAVQWLRDGLGMIEEPGETAALAATVADAGGAWVVPAFQGIGTPFGATEARGMMGGLSRGTTRAHVARAFLDGLAHRVADAAESVWEACARPQALRVDGGASANDVLLQMQADYLGVPVERSSIRDGAALGAAALAGKAAGLWHGSEGALAWKPDRVFEPGIGDGRREELRAVWKRRLNCCLAESA